MKKLLVLLTFASQVCLATTNAPATQKTLKFRMPAQTEAANSTSAQASDLIPALASQKLFITTNIVDLSKGNGNIDANFLVTERAAFSFNYITTSQSEMVPEVSQTGKIKVDRRAYGVGGAWFVRPFSTKTTFMINPTLQFGQKSDAINVDNQNGIRIKLSAIHKPTANFALEAGVRADNLEDNFKGEAVVGVGFIL